jgi:hypothetical protein
VGNLDILQIVKLIDLLNLIKSNWCLVQVTKFLKARPFQLYITSSSTLRPGGGLMDISDRTFGHFGSDLWTFRIGLMDISDKCSLQLDVSPCSLVIMFIKTSKLDSFPLSFYVQ